MIGPKRRGRRRTRFPVVVMALLVAGAIGFLITAPAQASRTELPPTQHNGELPPQPGSQPGQQPGGNGNGSPAPSSAPTPTPTPGQVCGSGSCINVGTNAAGDTNGFGNLAVCAQGQGDAATLANDLLNQQYATPEAAAEGCVNSDKHLSAADRAKLIQILRTARQHANQGPDQYQQYVDLVCWSITGLTTGGPSWFTGSAPDTDGNPPTMAELYADQDYAINVPQDITGLFGVNGNEIPAFGFPPAVNTGQAVIAIGDFSFSGTWMTAGSDSIGNAVKNLYRALFIPYLATVILLSVLFMFIRRGHHERGLVHVVSEGGWMVLGILLVIFFQVAPGQLLQNANGLSTGIAQQVLTAGVQASPGLSQASNVYEPNKPPAGSLSSEAPALKVYDQAWWQQNVYDAWTLINFGTVNPTSADGKRDLGTEMLADEQITGSNNEFSSSNDLKNATPQIQSFYLGTNPGLRVGYLALTYLNLIIAELLMAVVEVGLVIAYIGLLIAWLAIAVMGLLVVVPGKGREIAWSLCQVVIGLLTLRVIYAALLALVMIITEEVIPAIVGGNSWGAQFVFGGAVFAAVFFMRRRLMAPIAAVIHGHSVEHEGKQGRQGEGIRAAAQAGWARVWGGREAAVAGRAAAAGEASGAGSAAGAGAGATAGAGGTFSGFAAAAAPVAAVAAPFLVAGAVAYGAGMASFGDVRSMMGLGGGGGRHEGDHKREESPALEGRRAAPAPIRAPAPQAERVRVERVPAAAPAPAALASAQAEPPPAWMRLSGDEVYAEWREMPAPKPAPLTTPAVAGLPPMRS